MPVHSLRLYPCPCQSDPSNTADTARAFSPLAVRLPEASTPELLFLETTCAPVALYGVTAELLQHVLPIDDALAPCLIYTPILQPVLSCL
jgi:hypothetical protein